MVAVQFGMAGDCVCLLYCTSVYDVTGIKFSDIGNASAVEGGGNEEITGKEDRQGYKQPFGAYEDDGVDLEYIFISGPFE